MPTPRDSWIRELHALLARAAAMAVEHGVENDAFLRGAFAAYLDARPGLREELEHQQMVAELAALREAGRVASA
ncbi:MAG: hypothetical protein KF773_37960 [Deltaproteobacteria bacterium]|nr:hypothetical protein [Deltaproteobacteria bacterium]MCW5809098.1 hypothetical protein [Deltaproteobacteria bacterium]